MAKSMRIGLKETKIMTMLKFSPGMVEKNIYDRVPRYGTNDPIRNLLKRGLVTRRPLFHYQITQKGQDILTKKGYM